MDLQFDSPQQMVKHRSTRGSAGNLGGVVGGVLGGAGGAVALRNLGMPGMLAGGLAGALSGGALGKYTMRTTTDMAHDIPDSYTRTSEGIKNRLNRSAGLNYL